MHMAVVQVWVNDPAKGFLGGFLHRHSSPSFAARTGSGALPLLRELRQRLCRFQRQNIQKGTLSPEISGGKASAQEISKMPNTWRAQLL
jgi:hypothetical protein